MARHAVGWGLRVLFSRPLTREQELLALLAEEGEPLVAGWAEAHRDSVRDSADLLAALQQLQADGGPVARSLAATIWLAWRDFGGR